MKKTVLNELNDELLNEILQYWIRFAKDSVTSGFFGAIDNMKVPDTNEERSVVMVSRFLWTYSAAYSMYKKEEYLEMADYAFNYLHNHFFDVVHGGFFWSVNADGTPKVIRKQIYGNAFALYALSEYAAALYKAELDASNALDEASSSDKSDGGKSRKSSMNVINIAWKLYQLLQDKAYDSEYKGYYEARNRDWSWTDETKLSDKDIDCCKSMNTNLHIMEAFSALIMALGSIFGKKDFKVIDVQKALSMLITVHVECILQKNMHLALYFDRKWNVLEPNEISYGHDIESSWLLWEAAEAVGDMCNKKSVRQCVLAIAEVALNEGFDEKTGGMDNCLHPDGKRDSDRIWWVQAEAMNGFFNAWQLTQDKKYMNAVEKLWTWICTFQKDKSHGEWFNCVHKDGLPDAASVKGGNWKTSYHNGRVCMELLKRCGC
ncbi:MAG: AGE family epimerase/isomerase [Treponema sp.]|nr:AGE family epimerase/isomerase [Treponema sp.]